MQKLEIKVLDHGYVRLRNLAGPTRRLDMDFDADDIDPANAARFSFDGADKGRLREDDLKLANYLMKHKHTTPFEMIVAWFEMKMPIFVARQFVRHRTVSINEISGRYTKLPNDFYIPDTDAIGCKAATNKQGRTLTEVNVYADNFREILSATSEGAYAHYTKALEQGIPNELARCFLPLNIYTKWLWKQDLHNLMHLLMLRLDGHAQYEARQYAKAIYDLLNEALPNCMKLFREYRTLPDGDYQW